MARLIDLPDILNNVCPNVSRVESLGEGFPRIIYAEIGWTDEAYDNTAAYGRYIVSIDLYTETTDGNGAFDTLLNTLIENHIPFEVGDIAYGTLQTNKKSYQGITHYPIVCEVV